MCGKQRLLILDDDWAVARTLIVVAQRAGFEARSANDHTSFLQQADAWQPSHVAIDLVMRPIGGVETASLLSKRGCSAKIILTSGTGSERLRLGETMARERGLTIAGVLPKPFRAKDLHSLLITVPSEGERPALAVGEPERDRAVVTAPDADQPIDPEDQHDWERARPMRVVVMAETKFAREGLKALLAGDSCVVMVDESDYDASPAANLAVRCDVVVMDVSLCLGRAVTAARAIRQRNSGIGVVMIHGRRSDPALLCGSEDVADVLLFAEEVDPFMLADAVHRANVRAHGARSACGRNKAVARKHSKSGWSRLSVREQQVLTLIAEGRSRTEIAALCGVSPKTIDTYRMRLCEKLEIFDMANLVKVAVQYGLTSLD